MNKRKWQYAWAAVVLLCGCLVLLFETELLPMGVFCGEANVQYVMDIAVVTLTLAGIVLGTKAHNRPKVRLVCFSLPLVLALLVYYLFLSSAAPYCAAVTGVAMLLQWPRASTPEI